MKYYLNPYLTVQYKQGNYIVRNVIDNSNIIINSISDLFISNDLIKANIYITTELFDKYSIRFYEKLESKYKNQSTQIGYLETTTHCPYLCKICPKGNNKLKRISYEMKIDKFGNIISQLCNQDELELHLFGDPFFDPEIYEKIKICNSKGIYPSFSTNLVSLKYINFSKIKNCKIRILTVSIDSLDSELLSKYRGKVNQEDLDNGLDILNQLIDLNNKYSFVECINLQSINLKGNEDTEKNS